MNWKKRYIRFKPGDKVRIVCVYPEDTFQPFPNGTVVTLGSKYEVISGEQLWFINDLAAHCLYEREFEAI